jgi:hypothetical protein
VAAAAGLRAIAILPITTMGASLVVILIVVILVLITLLTAIIIIAVLLIVALLIVVISGFIIVSIAVVSVTLATLLVVILAVLVVVVIRVLAWMAIAIIVVASLRMSGHLGEILGRDVETQTMSIRSGGGRINRVWTAAEELGDNCCEVEQTAGMQDCVDKVVLARADKQRVNYGGEQ